VFVLLQLFFKAGLQGAPNSTELFELSTQQGLLESIRGLFA
jgi:hypothetical protein